MLSSVDDFGRGASLGVTAMAMGPALGSGSSRTSVVARRVGAGELLGEAAFFTEVRRHMRGMAGTAQAAARKTATE